MRILHVSDIHIGIPLRRVPLSSWLGKRALGGLNLLLGRGRHFADARRKVAALAEFADREGVDLVVNTGDYTGLGLEDEFVDARRAVAQLTTARLGFVTVPGNHDLYVREVVEKGRFEHHFGDLLTTDLPQYQAEGGWPRARLIGDDLAIVTVNSSRPNASWRANGEVPAAQLEMLRPALADPAVRDRFILIVTHYAPCLEDGGPDHRSHCLVNVDELLDACREVQRGAYLCGHIHRRFEARMPGFHLPVFCAGSATKDGREGLWMFDFEDGRLGATPGSFADGEYRLEEAADPGGDGEAALGG